MKLNKNHNYVSLDIGFPIWDKTFIAAPLVVIGTKENDGYDMAPKHMITPLGFQNYFGFVCTPKHATYRNVKVSKTFTVSFLLPESVTIASLSAFPRDQITSKSENIINALPTLKSDHIDALILKDSYLRLECKLFKIIDGFGENSIISGIITHASVNENYLIESEKDQQSQLKDHGLLVYIAPGRFAKVTETFNFPFPKGFKR
ncbi:NADH-FMN oxidoreductase RutF, flavin reductase (DIM6/NTAB) family [Zhouia amylolytica]|uniref:NADH-FMN oxidoreductase RutF, flavin reductase (DIM6/NTAB) family n=1 Tax=Zhouia amylolytica TaxID=376730 RepID=A0A1I6T1B4_9FLAO|nr:flavin reductase [Zhouia amylolytica]MCQ0112662.1 flavin reductase [Zhouia amylolytica]SFS82956.1 NADH-FMN oxidoreductase RutF, flavin reductase (DIM6/NTAB) family [Zhouia amylolytica]